MQYILLIYGDEALDLNMSEAEQQQLMDEYYKFTAAVRDRGAYITSEALHPISTATTVRVRESKTLTTDGPFAETKEQLGGFYLIDAKDLDEAIEIAAQIPNAKTGSVEVRPVMTFS